MERTGKTGRSIGIFILAAYAGLGCFLFAETAWKGPRLFNVGQPFALQTYAWAQQEGDSENLQWFKEEMKISPKYLEEEQGIMGMSWAHFFTMVFLVAFLLGALIEFYLRNRRTKNILEALLKEGNHESEGGVQEVRNNR